MLRDGTSGDWIGTFSGHKGAVWSCQMDASGSLVATASGDYSVIVWDAITGKELYTFPHNHIVKTCDFSPNSKLLATGGHEGIVRVYELEHPTNDPKLIEQDASEKKVVIAKVCWLTETMLLIGCGDGSVRFWDVQENKLMHTLKTTDAEVRDMEISRKHAILTVASGDKVSFFNLETMELIHCHKMPIHFKNEGGASLHPVEDKFVAGGSDLWVRVFSYSTGEQLECLKGHHGPVRCLRYSPDGKTYASGSEDGTIRLWKSNVDE
jgi:serine-threonine kinase receptor-associated protein